KLLNGDGSAVASTPEKRKRNSRQHHHRRNVQYVEAERRHDGAQPKLSDLHAEDKCPIDVLIGWSTLKVNPSQREWKGNCCSKNASPRDQPMCCPAQVGTLLDEALGKEVSQEELNQAADIGNKLLWTKEELPSAEPIASSRWPAQPHGVAISDTERG